MDAAAAAASVIQRTFRIYLFKLRDALFEELKLLSAVFMLQRFVRDVVLHRPRDGGVGRNSCKNAKIDGKWKVNYGGYVRISIGIAKKQRRRIKQAIKSNDRARIQNAIDDGKAAGLTRNNCPEITLGLRKLQKIERIHFKQLANEARIEHSKRFQIQPT